MERELNLFFNDFLINTKFEIAFIISNLDLYLRISYISYGATKEEFNHKIETKPIKIGLEEKINLINGFYKYINVDFDVNKVINDGTINFFHSNYGSEATYETEDVKNSASNYYIGLTRHIDTYSNGLLSDIVLLIHELSHLRNQPIPRRGLTNSIFTETLAYVEELIYYDYLEEVGFKEQSEIQRKLFLSHLYTLSDDAIAIARMFKLFTTLGNISLDNYKMMYGDDNNYEYCLFLINKVKDDDFLFKKNALYSLGFPLATYLYMQYKEDHTFIETINGLHDAINTKGIKDCLSMMNLKNFGDDDLIKISNSLIKFRDEIVLTDKKKCLRYN